MEYLKSFVITLSVTLIFISTIEMILPNCSIKKYVKFILGLILMAVILNPVVYFLTKGEASFVSSIGNYVKKVKDGDLEIQNNNLNTNEIFLDKLEYSCNKILKDKFKDLDFETDIKGKFHTKELDVDFDYIKIKYFNKGINKIAKVSIELDRTKKTDDKEDYIAKEIKSFIAEELKVNKEKISVEKGS